MQTIFQCAVNVDEVCLDVRVPGAPQELTFDRLASSEIAAWVEFTFSKGDAPIVTGPMEDSDPGSPDEVSIKRITALGIIEFMGSYSTATDPSELDEYVALTIPMDHDIKNLFTDKQLSAIEDEIMARYMNGEFNDA